MTTAAGAILVLCDCTIFTANVIAFAFEIIRMASSAERLVLGKRPGNSAADNRAVTGCTTWIHAVIARVVPSRTMGEAGRCPAVGGMTNVALFSGTQVSSGLGGRSIAGAVAVATSTRTTGVMCPAAVSEGCCGMTGGAVQAGLNMRGYSIHHAYCGSAIVTRNTIVDDAGMIEGCRDEAARVMADTTILTGRDMTGVLGCSETSAMTGRAVIHDTRVTKTRRFKAGGLMAVDAIIVGRYMEIGFPGSGSTVVAAHTVIQDSLVFEGGTGKGGCVVAHRAILGCVPVNWVIR